MGHGVCVPLTCLSSRPLVHLVVHFHPTPPAAWQGMVGGLRRLFDAGHKTKWATALKWLVVALVFNTGARVCEVYGDVGIPKRTVERWVARYNVTGDVSTGKHACVFGAGARTLGRAGRRKLATLVQENPWMYLDEMVLALGDAGYVTSEPVVCRTLKRLGLGLKKVRRARGHAGCVWIICSCLFDYCQFSPALAPARALP